MPDLIDLAKRAVEVAVADGAEFADASVSEGRGLSAKFEKSSLHSTRDRQSVSVSVRAIVKGATGFSSDARLTRDAAQECARRAVAAAKLAEPDPDFVRIPPPSEFVEVEGLDDPEVAKLDLPWLIDAFGAELDAARAVDGRVIVGGGASSGFSRSALVNSCGVEHEHASSNVSVSISPIVKDSEKDGEDVGSYFDFKFARRLSDFSPPRSPGELGRKAAEVARSFLGAERAPTGVFPVVLGPLAARSLLYGVAAAACGEGIQRDRSFLGGRLGDRIASEHLTLVDDGLIPGGMGSGALDGEGSLRKRVTVVEKGVFRQELHGLYTAEKARKRGERRENTGHGSRGGGGGPTNVIPELGGKTADEIIAETGEGIYVNVGGVFPNMVTGEISASVDFGFKIEGGKLAYPLKNTMLGVNVFDFLKAVDAVSSDARLEPGMVLPTIRATGVRVAGRNPPAGGKA